VAKNTPPPPDITAPAAHDHQTGPLAGKYQTWFLDYASYVILDRAVPAIEDGLKPVQRRLLHALKSIDDGRYHKVANVVGQTMQYHPHGDASIYEALVNLGQKDLLIDTQGNWGDYRTGDTAAAPRYIEARLSKLALEIAFHADLTEWQLSYDGRKKEPVTLPMKFPLLLAQGVEGIAVGLATRILPHNFNELVEASIKILQKKTFIIYPDFLTGGLIDVADYREGQRGGKVRVRARIECPDKKTLIIRDIPYGTNTQGLIDSIIKANDKGKIKIKKVTDNTAKDVEIVIELTPGVSPDVTIDALYAFTDCEVSISPNCCVIIDKKPHFVSVNDLLNFSTQHTTNLLKRELELKLNDLREKLHFASLEQIFIEKRIYRRIEECETFEAVIEAIQSGLKPYTKNFIRVVTRDDIIRLTEIKIKRISKYDSFQANEAIKQLQADISQTEHHLTHLTDFAIAYFKNLLTKYGKGRERRTEIRSFDTIKVRQVALANEKLYVNRTDGFMGYGLKKDEYVCDCSDIDNIIVIRKDGKLIVTPIGEKVFVGKDILHIDVWRQNDERRTYHIVYLDGKTGQSLVKRFNVTAVTYKREYDITQGTPNSKILYLSVHPNSEGEVISVQLSPTSNARNKQLEYDFTDLEVRNRNTKGNLLTKYPVRSVKQKEVGSSTIGGRKIWLDEKIGRLNTEGRGQLLGEFDTGDTILTIYQDGNYEMTDFELTNRYEMDKLVLIEKHQPDKIISAVYLNKEKADWFVKRFRIETAKLNEKFCFIGETKGSALELATTDPDPVAEYIYLKKKGGEKLTNLLIFNEFIDVKGWKSMGNKLFIYSLKDLRLLTEVEKLKKIPTISLTAAQTHKTTSNNTPIIAPNPDKIIDGEQGSLFG
jgi:topoisomerase-4 subunit A